MTEIWLKKPTSGELRNFRKIDWKASAIERWLIHEPFWIESGLSETLRPDPARAGSVARAVSSPPSLSLSSPVEASVG